MILYEFYWINGSKHELVGVLPERRRSPKRITQDSIIGWVKEIYNRKSAENIYFIRVVGNETTGQVFRPTPVFITYINK